MFEFLCGCAAVKYLFSGWSFSLPPSVKICPLCGVKVIVHENDAYGGGTYWTDEETGAFHQHMCI